jgi:polyisoprenoid-binding protein YceI
LFSEFDLRLALYEAEPEATRAEARIVAASLTTGLAVRDRALHSRSCLDLERHPYITFVSSAVSRSASLYRIVGDLAIKGRRRQVELLGESSGIVDARGYRRATMHLAAEVAQHG